MNNAWFYLHCFAAIAILWADATDKLEPAFNAFEQKMGLYTPPDTTEYEEPPFYIPPIQEEESVIDSNYVDIKNDRL